ncbi:hypothetical protein M1D51_17100 [Arthrobacter sp. R3-55]
MDFPLFHDPLQGAVTVDAPARDPQIRRQARATQRSTRPATHRREQQAGSIRQREVAKVADDLRALMKRSVANG